MTSASSVPQIMIINTVLTVTVIANEWNHGCCASFTRHRGGSVLDARSAWQLPVFQWDRAILGFRMVQRCSKEFRVVSSWPSRAAKPCTRFPAVYPQTFSDLPRLFVTFMSFVCGYQSGSGNPEIPDVGDPQPKAVISSYLSHPSLHSARQRVSQATPSTLKAQASLEQLRHHINAELQRTQNWIDFEVQRFISHQFAPAPDDAKEVAKDGAPKDKDMNFKDGSGKDSPRTAKSHSPRTSKSTSPRMSPRRREEKQVTKPNVPPVNLKDAQNWQNAQNQWGIHDGEDVMLTGNLCTPTGQVRLSPRQVTPSRR
eukprot:s690_g7.t1